MSVLPGRGLRVAVVGGNFGATVQLPAFRAAGAEVVAIAASSRERAEQLAAQHLVPRGCESIAEVLDNHVDAIGVAVPPVECETILPRLLEARVPLFAEKPLGVSVTSADILAVRAQGLVTAVDFEFGELRTFSALKRIADDEVLGKPQFGQITWLTRSLAQSQGAWSWKTDARRGGGAISMFASQVLYLVEWIFGEIISVSAVTNQGMTRRFTPQGEVPADDGLHAALEFRSGLTISMLISLVSPSRPFQRWEMAFDGGFVTIDNIDASTMMDFKLNAVNQEGKQLIAERESGLSVGDSRISAVASLAGRFFTAIKAGTPVLPDFRVGARVQLLVDALRRSAACKQCVTIDGS